MRVQYAKRFEKRFKKLPQNIKNKTIALIEKFIKNPHDSALKNHALKGKLADKKAISVTDNIRIVFRESENYKEVIILDIGPHESVYK